MSSLGPDRRVGTARRGMTVLGKIPAAPKPINLPSQKLGNKGLDPSVAIVPRGTVSWGATPKGTSAWSSPETALSPSPPPPSAWKAPAAQGQAPSASEAGAAGPLGSGGQAGNKEGLAAPIQHQGEPGRGPAAGPARPSPVAPSDELQAHDCQRPGFGAYPGAYVPMPDHPMALHGEGPPGGYFHGEPHRPFSGGGPRGSASAGNSPTPPLAAGAVFEGAARWPAVTSSGRTVDDHIRGRAGFHLSSGDFPTLGSEKPGEGQPKKAKDGQAEKADADEGGDKAEDKQGRPWAHGGEQEGEGRWVRDGEGTGLRRWEGGWDAEKEGRDQRWRGEGPPDSWRGGRGGYGGPYQFDGPGPFGPGGFGGHPDMMGGAGPYAGGYGGGIPPRGYGGMGPDIRPPFPGAGRGGPMDYPPPHGWGPPGPRGMRDGPPWPGQYPYSMGGPRSGFGPPPNAPFMFLDGGPPNGRGPFGFDAPPGWQMQGQPGWAGPGRMARGGPDRSDADAESWRPTHQREPGGRGGKEGGGGQGDQKEVEGPSGGVVERGADRPGVEPAGGGGGSGKKKDPQVSEKLEWGADDSEMDFASVPVLELDEEERKKLLESEHHQQQQHWQQLQFRRQHPGEGPLPRTGRGGRQGSTFSPEGGDQVRILKRSEDSTRAGAGGREQPPGSPLNLGRDVGDAAGAPPKVLGAEPKEGQVQAAGTPKKPAPFLPPARRPKATSPGQQGQPSGAPPAVAGSSRPPGMDPAPAEKDKGGSTAAPQVAPVTSADSAPPARSDSVAEGSAARVALEPAQGPQQPPAEGIGQGEDGGKPAEDGVAGPAGKSSLSPDAGQDAATRAIPTGTGDQPHVPAAISTALPAAETGGSARGHGVGRGLAADGGGGRGLDHGGRGRGRGHPQQAQGPGGHGRSKGGPPAQKGGPPIPQGRGREGKQWNAKRPGGMVEGAGAARGGRDGGRGRGGGGPGHPGRPGAGQQAGGPAAVQEQKPTGGTLEPVSSAEGEVSTMQDLQASASVEKGQPTAMPAAVAGKEKGRLKPQQEKEGQGEGHGEELNLPNAAATTEEALVLESTELDMSSIQIPFGTIGLHEPQQGGEPEASPVTVGPATGPAGAAGPPPQFFFHPMLGPGMVHHGPAGPAFFAMRPILAPGADSGNMQPFLPPPPPGFSWILPVTDPNMLAQSGGPAGHQQQFLGPRDAPEEQPHEQLHHEQHQHQHQQRQGQPGQGHQVEPPLTPQGQPGQQHEQDRHQQPPDTSGKQLERPQLGHFPFPGAQPILLPVHPFPSNPENGERSKAVGQPTTVVGTPWTLPGAIPGHRSPDTEAGQAAEGFPGPLLEGPLAINPMTGMPMYLPPHFHHGPLAGQPPHAGSILGAFPVPQQQLQQHQQHQQEQEKGQEQQQLQSRELRPGGLLSEQGQGTAPGAAAGPVEGGTEASSLAAAGSDVPADRAASGEGRDATQRRDGDRRGRGHQGRGGRQDVRGGRGHGQSETIAGEADDAAKGKKAGRKRGGKKGGGHVDEERDDSPVAATGGPAANVEGANLAMAPGASGGISPGTAECVAVQQGKETVGGGRPGTGGGHHDGKGRGGGKRQGGGDWKGGGQGKPRRAELERYVPKHAVQKAQQEQQVQHQASGWPQLEPEGVARQQHQQQQLEDRGVQQGGPKGSQQRGDGGEGGALPRPPSGEHAQVAPGPLQQSQGGASGGRHEGWHGPDRRGKGRGGGRARGGEGGRGAEEYQKGEGSVLEAPSGAQATGVLQAARVSEDQAGHGEKSRVRPQPDQQLPSTLQERQEARQQEPSKGGTTEAVKQPLFATEAGRGRGGAHVHPHHGGRGQPAYGRGPGHHGGPGHQGGGGPGPQQHFHAYGGRGRAGGGPGVHHGAPGGGPSSALGSQGRPHIRGSEKPRVVIVATGGAKPLTIPSSTSTSS